MNQILFSADDNENKTDKKNVAKIFAILILLFGIILIITGIYQFLNLMKEKQIQMEALKIPEVKFSLENNIVKLEASHNKIISTIIYNWNNEDTITLTENKLTGIVEKIDVPAGKNILHVKLIDETGKSTDYSEEFSYTGTYMDVSVVDGQKLKIVVTDVIGLQSVTYKWNLEEEAMVLPDDDETTIEIITDIPDGLNTISISSVNKENEIKNKEQEVQGITKPVVKVKVSKADSIFKISLKDDQGIKSYSYKLYSAEIVDVAENGKLIENYKEKLTLIRNEEITSEGEYELDEIINMIDGFNYLELTVKNIEGAEETVSGWSVK